MILIFFLLMHPSERPYTGLTEAQGLQHGLAFQNTTALSLDNNQMLACASVQQAKKHQCRNGHPSHPLEILFDGQNSRVPDIRFETLQPRGTNVIAARAGVDRADHSKQHNAGIGSAEFKADPFIDSGDPRIQDLMSEMSGERNNRVLFIKY